MRDEEKGMREKKRERKGEEKKGKRRGTRWRNESDGR